MSEYIGEYLTNSHWRRKENANVNESFSSLTNYVSSKLLANDFLMSLSKEQRDAHENGLLHIHNLETGGYIPYCSGHSLKMLLMNGIKTPSINSKPAKHFNSLMDHIMNWLYCSQMEMAGAQSFGDWDTLIAPFIKKEKLSYKDVKQQIQKLVFNLNFTMRSSSQTPFTNLTMNIGSPKFLKDEQAIVGGEEAGFTYGDCTDEIYMVDKAITEIMNTRDSTGKPFTFPILTINLNGRFPWDSELANIIANNCANLGSFYFMNYVNSGIDEDILRSMCCRLSLRLDQMSGPKGMWNMGEGVGSMGVCLTGDTWVRVKNIPKGKQISNLNIGDILYTIEDGAIKETKITKLFTREVDKLIKLTYKKGDKKRSIKGTIEHPILTVNGWKKLEEIEIGDTLVYADHLCQFARSEKAIKSWYNKDKLENNLWSKSHNKLHKHEERAVKIIKEYNLPIEWNYGNIIIRDNLHSCVPDIITSDNKIIEIWKNKTSKWNMLAETKTKIYEAKGYKVLNMFIEGMTDKEIINDILKFMSNGVKVLSKEIIIWEELKYKPLKKGFMVYNIECDPYHSYISNGLISHNCTINLPRLGHDARGNETVLFELLSHRLELALSILKARKERIKANMKSMMPFNMMNGWSMKNYFMTIGILGFNEFTLNFMNKDILDKDAQNMMIKTLQFMRDWCMTKQQETRELINIEQVPAEGCSYRLAKVDKKLNQDIITLGTDAAPYYSSVYIPHNYEVDMIDRIAIEEKALPLFSGGTIFRTLIGEKEPSSKAVLDYIKMIANTKIPYFDLTTTFAVCETDNKVIRGTAKVCPDCNSPTEVWSRVVGYYRSTNKWNIGKVAEFDTRRYVNIDEALPK